MSSRLLGPDIGTVSGLGASPKLVSVSCDVCLTRDTRQSAAGVLAENPPDYAAEPTAIRKPVYVHGELLICE